MTTKFVTSLLIKNIIYHKAIKYNSIIQFPTQISLYLYFFICMFIFCFLLIFVLSESYLFNMYGISYVNSIK